MNPDLSKVKRVEAKEVGEVLSLPLKGVEAKSIDNEINIEKIGNPPRNTFHNPGLKYPVIYSPLTSNKLIPNFKGFNKLPLSDS